ncbi:hypothetical protein [Hyphomonas sp.]|uniref:hypothetical protein n=1 Tax=Hyphomonas sp. TaxID=87 RepID=UPI00391C8F0A
MRHIARLMIASALSCLFNAAQATPINERYVMEFRLEPDERRVVFLADDSSAAAGQLPTLRICYMASGTIPAAEALMVRMGVRTQRLRPGECGFFTGGNIETSVPSGDGRVLVSVALLR